MEDYVDIQIYREREKEREKRDISIFICNIYKINKGGMKKYRTCNILKSEESV